MTARALAWALGLLTIGLFLGMVVTGMLMCPIGWPVGLLLALFVSAGFFGALGS